MSLYVSWLWFSVILVGAPKVLPVLLIFLKLDAPVLPSEKVNFEPCTVRVLLYALLCRLFSCVAWACSRVGQHIHNEWGGVMHTVFTTSHLKRTLLSLFLFPCSSIFLTSVLVSSQVVPKENGSS